MVSGSFRFDRFELDPDDRQLRRDDRPVELNARYLDALTLLVRDAGKLVSKDRFLDEVWRGVPVTDEALTQCIRTLRKQLGDDAGRPRFIETVPKHGYRFIAPVEAGTAAAPRLQQVSRENWREVLMLGGAGTLGGGLAGIIGGLIYGFAAASQLTEPGTGTISVLLVLLWLTTVVALMGGAGVSFGIALAGMASRPLRPRNIAGGAGGGLIVGAIVKLLGLDAFTLLFGRSPGDITGAMEGLIIGAAVGLGAWLGSWRFSAPRLRRSVAGAAACGATAGIVVALLGGRMMAGSLDLVARSFPGSQLRLDRMGALLGESGFGAVTQLVTAALEGALFGGCVVGAMILAQRHLARTG